MDASETKRLAKRIGSVPYLNSAPLTYGMESETEFLLPSQLAKRLRAGEFDAGLVSLTEVLHHDLYDILDGVAVASDGPVKSVFIAHKKPLTDTEVIHCDTASLCSVNLLKVILAHHGLSPRLEPFGDYARAAGQDAVLLIGNPGIEFLRQPHEHKILDLGQAWQDMTGLPFVFAVWAIRRDCSDPALGQKLLRPSAMARRTSTRSSPTTMSSTSSCAAPISANTFVLIWANQRNRASRNLSAASAPYQPIRFSILDSPPPSNSRAWPSAKNSLGELFGLIG